MQRACTGTLVHYDQTVRPYQGSAMIPSDSTNAWNTCHRTARYLVLNNDAGTAAFLLAKRSIISAIGAANV